MGLASDSSGQFDRQAVGKVLSILLMRSKAANAMGSRTRARKVPRVQSIERKPQVGFWNREILAGHP
jgi:hypothetical protein